MTLAKRFLFITTNNLATNPRLVKELKLAEKNGYETTVILFNLANWSDKLDKDLQTSFSTTKFIQLSATSSPFWPWVLSSIAEKLLRFLPVNWLNTSMLSISTGKRSYLLQKTIRDISCSYDWVVAHNPASFYPALQAAKKTGALLGIDVEDYHPGETNDGKLASVIKRLMQMVLPKAAYCSYAAPLIMAEVKKDIPNLQQNQIVILNGFDESEFLPPQIIDKVPLQLVWYSQNINFKRGLENIIPVVNKLYPSVELNLIGNLSYEFEKEYLKNKIGIVLHGIKSQKELHHCLSIFDIGLAIDIPVDRNRELALTNKIIAFAQAGLFIVATHTRAQDIFLADSEVNYRQMDNTKSAIENLLNELYNKKNELRKSKIEQYANGRKYDWHRLVKPVLNIWQN